MNLTRGKIIKTLIIGCFLVFASTVSAFSQEAGPPQPQPQPGGATINQEDIKKMLDALKLFQDQLKSFQGSISSLIKEVETSKVDIGPLKEGTENLTKALEGLKEELIRRWEEESKFAKEEFLSRLDFLTTVMRRAMAVFQNIEDLTRETQMLKEQLTTSVEKLKRANELLEKGFEYSRNTQTKMLSLLVINFLLLAFIIFLQVERRFRRPPKKGDDLPS